jgi:hypothetical protein
MRRASARNASIVAADAQCRSSSTTTSGRAAARATNARATASCTRSACALAPSVGKELGAALSTLAASSGTSVESVARQSGSKRSAATSGSAERSASTIA